MVDCQTSVSWVVLVDQRQLEPITSTVRQQQPRGHFLRPSIQRLYLPTTLSSLTVTNHRQYRNWIYQYISTCIKQENWFRCHSIGLRLVAKCAITHCLFVDGNRVQKPNHHPLSTAGVYLRGPLSLLPLKVAKSTGSRQMWNNGCYDSLTHHITVLIQSTH